MSSIDEFLGIKPSKGPAKEDGDNIDAFLGIKEGPKKPAAMPSASGALVNTLKSALQGATLGASDELTAAGIAMTALPVRKPDGSIGVAFPGSNAPTFSERYGENLAGERSGMEQFRRESPVMSTVAEIGGAVAGTNPIMRAVRPAATAVGRIGQALGIGGSIGATQGFASGTDGPEDRSRQAVKGAIIGAPLAGALQAIPEAAGVVRNLVRQPPADERAAAILANTLRRDNSSPAKLQSDLSASPGSDIIDVGGENVKRLARSVAAQPGKAANAQKEFVELRGVQSYRDVNNSVLRAFNPEDYTTKIGSLRERIQKGAEEAYGEAFAGGPTVRSKAIDEILDTPAGQSALRTVMSRVEPGKESALGPVNAVTGLVDNYYLEALHRVKRELYARGVAAGPSKLTAGNSEEAAYFKSLSGKLNAELKNSSEAYRKAAEKYADEAHVIEAMQKGADEFLTMRPNEIRDFVKGLNSQAERESFLTGAYDAIERSSMIAGANRNIAARILQDPRTTERVRAAVGDSAWNTLRDDLRKQSERFVNTSFVSARGGSQTEPRRGDLEAVTSENIGSAVRGAANLAGGNVGSAASNFAQPLFRMLGKARDRAQGRGLDEQSAAILSDVLLRPASSMEAKIALRQLLGDRVPDAGKLRNPSGAMVPLLQLIR